MAIVTINGQFGGGAREAGSLAAQLLEADYVDRLILVEAAKRMGATVEALAEREERPRTFADRLARILERAAVAGMGGEFAPTEIETILSRVYEDVSQHPITRAQELDDSRFIQVTTEVVQDLARGGNVVIVGRGSNIILKDVPGALHVGMVAPYEKRLKVIMEREHIEDRSSAEHVAQARERARVDFFRKFFKAHPEDPSLYHLMLNTERLDFATAAAIIADAARRYERQENPAS